MSIIERSNPLNLQYRVCLVTAASTPLGVIVCKTLLKANAFVLGIDARPVDHSLNAGLGTHFQFEQCDLDDAGTAARIVAAAKDKFGLERLDALISLVNAGQGLAGIEQLSGSVGEVMRDDRRGLIVNVLTPGASDNTAVLSCTKRLVSEYLKDGVRCNAILPKGGAVIEKPHGPES
jgi:NAD(P)-dependent dehydrogenase (short-subunit alcohol dehydrogenase family)